MLQLLVRAWKFVVAALTGRLDEMASPNIQIEQAIEDAKTQHELLTRQAAAVLSNRLELELKLSRQLEEVEKLRASARQALILEEQARGAGDEAKAKSYEETAQAFANHLVQAERSTRDLKGLHDQALQASAAARRAVERNAFLLQKGLAERSRLLSQLEQTRTQERMNEALQSVSELSIPGDARTLNEVRDRIESRYARAMGRAEMESTNAEARMLEVERAAIDSQGAERLNQIRQALAMERGGGPAVEAGEGHPVPVEQGSDEG
jgi:phage shock protein A